jgi:hypothetical protein
MRTTLNKSEAEPAPSKPANAKPPDIVSASGKSSAKREPGWTQNKGGSSDGFSYAQSGKWLS